MDKNNYWQTRNHSVTFLKITNMYNQPKARFIVPAAMAILLTFGRSGMLPFEGIYTLLDQAMNIFVVIVAPLFAFKDIYSRPTKRNLHLFLPLFLLACWVSVCVFVGSPIEYWPPQTTLITIVLSILLASQITRFELRRLRHCMLLLAGVFSCYTLTFAQSTLHLIFAAGLEMQLGIDISSANVIIFPRIMYMLIITCFISLVIEKNIWIKICSAAIVILPILIALSTGGRGALVGFIVAAFAFIFGLGNKLKSFYAALTGGVLAIISYFSISILLPVMQSRIVENRTSTEERFDIWTNLLDTDITWFGRGITTSYPHNIFLEFLYNYGIIGLVLFLLVLTISVVTVLKYFRHTRDQEALWVLSLLVLQLTAQQFSLDIFYGGLWAAMLLPLGLSWKQSQVCEDNSVPYGERGVYSRHMGF